MVMFRSIFIASTFCIFLHCNQLFWGSGHCVMALPLEAPCRNQRQIQREDLFSEITMFWGQKLTKLRQIPNEDLCVLGPKIDQIEKIQSCKFSLLLFNQVSFRSNVVSIKCCFDQVSIR